MAIKKLKVSNNIKKQASIIPVIEALFIHLGKALIIVWGSFIRVNKTPVKSISRWNKNTSMVFYTNCHFANLVW